MDHDRRSCAPRRHARRLQLDWGASTDLAPRLQYGGEYSAGTDAATTRAAMWSAATLEVEIRSWPLPSELT